MATPTSSSNRSTRKTKKPVTQGQDPQRSNRQKVSNANVTNSTQRTSNGTARVTTGRGVSKPAALPPGNRGGQPVRSTAKPTNTNSVQQVRVRDLGSTKPNAMSGSGSRALPPGNQGGQLAGAARTAATTLGKVGAAGKVLPVVGTLLTAAGEVAAMADRQKRWNDYKARTGLDKKTDAQTGGTRRGAAAGTRTNSSAKPTKPPLTSTGVRTPKGNTVATGSPEYNRYRQAQLDATKQRNTQVRDTTPSRQSSTQSGGGSTQSRSGGSSSPSRPSTPAPRRIPSPASDAGMKNQDKNYRGNLFEKTFGYKPGSAPDQVRDRTSNLSNKFGQDSGYQPKTKVDGSQYADKKPDMAKVKEYDRRKRRYYDS